MADKKNEFDDIEQLLSGISDDLLSPSKKENTESSEQIPTPEPEIPAEEPALPPDPVAEPAASVDDSNEKQIMDLLAGLDDTSSFGSSTVSEPISPSMDFSSGSSEPETAETPLEMPETIPPSEPELEVEKTPADSDDIFANMPGLEPEASIPAQQDEPLQMPELPEEPSMPELPTESPETVEELPPVEEGSTLPDLPQEETAPAEPSSPLEGLDDLLDAAPPILDDGVTAEETAALMAPEETLPPIDEEPKPIEKPDELNIPDIDLSLPDSPLEKTESSPLSGLDDLPGMEMPDFKDVETAESIPATPVQEKKEKPKFQMPFFGGKKKEAEEKIVESAPEPSKPEPRKEKEGIKLNEKQLNFIYKRISHFGPQLKETTVNVVQKELLPLSDINYLLNMILHKKTVKQIKEFLERKLKTKISGPLLDPQYQRQLVEKEEARHPRAERAFRERSVRGPRPKPAYLEDFENNVLPILRPLIIVVAVLVVAGILLYPPIWSKKLVTDGVALIKKANIDDITVAEDNFQKALKLRNKYHDAYIAYARAYLQIEGFSQAKNKLMEYKNLAGDNFKFNLAMGDLVLAQEYFSEAMTYFTKALDLNKNSFEAVDGLGRSYFAMDDLEASKKTYEKYLEKNPKNVQAHYKVLRVFIKQGSLEQVDDTHLDEINAKYDQILAMKPKKIDPVVVTELGRYYINRAKTEPKKRFGSKREDLFRRADTVLKTVISKENKYAPGFFQLSRLRYEKNDLLRAQRAAQHAIDLDANRAEYHSLLGKIYAKRKLWDKATESYEKSASKNSDYAVAFYNIAHLSFYHASNYGEALKNYEITLELMPEAEDYELADIEIPEVYYNTGFLRYRQSGDYTGALEILNRLGQDFPDKPAYLMLAANAYYQLGQYASARKYYESAVGALTSFIADSKRINPRRERDRQLHEMLSTVYNNLALTWYQLDNRELALKNLWSSVETVKTVGFFKENENANVNINLILYPTGKNTSGKLIFDERLPRHYDFPD